MLMIASTSSAPPPMAYTILITLYSYVVIVLVRFFVAAALLYLRFRDGKAWTSTAGFKPWGGPTAAMIYFAVFGFLLVTAFIPPSSSSSFSRSAKGGVEWFVVPSIGLSFLVLGYLYYLGFAYLIPRLRKEDLVVRREPVIVKEKGEWVQQLEVVEAIWVARSESGSAVGVAQVDERKLGV